MDAPNIEHHQDVGMTYSLHEDLMRIAAIDIESVVVVIRRACRELVERHDADTARRAASYNYNLSVALED